jgi:DNA polymerase-3 subunit delta
MLSEVMAQKKAHEVDGWLRRPDPRTAVVLVYGPDRGLVAERASTFAKNAGFPPEDPFSVVKLAGDDIDGDPGRLIDEMRTIPMFSDRRLVWLRTGTPSKAATEAIRSLAEDPPAGAVLLIETGDLKKGAALRSLAEGAAAAIALPCYADDSRSLDAIIDDIIEHRGIGISLEARQALKRSLGGDRLASRGEVEKLALYAEGEPQITLDHVEALTGDASGPALDAALDAMIVGRIDDFDRAFSRLAASGQLVPLLLGALRQFHAMDLMRHQVEAHGKTAAGAVAGARPPIFYARREVVEKAVALWSRAMIARALDRLQSVVFQSRERAALAIPLARQALLGLAVEAARVSRNR